jgi:hypothetical protein
VPARRAARGRVTAGGAAGRSAARKVVAPLSLGGRPGPLDAGFAQRAQRLLAALKARESMPHRHASRQRPCLLCWHRAAAPRTDGAEGIPPAGKMRRRAVESAETRRRRQATVLGGLRLSGALADAGAGGEGAGHGQPGEGDTAVESAVESPASAERGGRVSYSVLRFPSSPSRILSVRLQAPRPPTAAPANSPAWACGVPPPPAAAAARPAAAPPRAHAAGGAWLRSRAALALAEALCEHRPPAGRTAWSRKAAAAEAARRRLAFPQHAEWRELAPLLNGPWLLLRPPGRTVSARPPAAVHRHARGAACPVCRARRTALGPASEPSLSRAARRLGKRSWRTPRRSREALAQARPGPGWTRKTPSNAQTLRPNNPAPEQASQPPLHAPRSRPRTAPLRAHLSRPAAPSTLNPAPPRAQARAPAPRLGLIERLDAARELPGAPGAAASRRRPRSARAGRARGAPGADSSSSAASSSWLGVGGDVAASSSWLGVGGDVADGGADAAGWLGGAGDAGGAGRAEEEGGSSAARAWGELDPRRAPRSASPERRTAEKRAGRESPAWAAELEGMLQSSGAGGSRAESSW